MNEQPQNQIPDGDRRHSEDPAEGPDPSRDPYDEGTQDAPFDDEERDAEHPGGEDDLDGGTM